MKAIGWLITSAIGATIVVVVWVSSVKRDLADHATALATMQATLSADHDIGVTHTAQIQSLAATLGKMDHKLDYLTGARKDRPEGGSTDPAGSK